MDIRELYSGLRRIQNRGETGNAYGGCGTVDEDRDVLGDFFDYVVEKYEDSMPPWAEAFMQVFSWQFQTLHEGAETYYSNEYGDSDYVTITRVTAFLRENGYDEIAESYGLAAADCEQYQYPEDKIDLLPDDWIETHEQVVWDFYVDILEKHKEDFA